MKKTFFGLILALFWPLKRLETRRNLNLPPERSRNFEGLHHHNKVASVSGESENERKKNKKVIASNFCQAAGLGFEDLEDLLAVRGKTGQRALQGSAQDRPEGKRNERERSWHIRGIQERQREIKDSQKVP